MLAMKSFRSGIPNNDAFQIELRIHNQHERNLHSGATVSDGSAEPHSDTDFGAFGDHFAHSLEELDVVEQLHHTLDPDRDAVERSACQTAASRALWCHVTHDTLAKFLAGKAFVGMVREKLRRDQASKSRELAGVMLAVRTLWFDSQLEIAVERLSWQPQVVILGAGMDARAYRLYALARCAVFEVDLGKLLDLKDSILDVVEKAGTEMPALIAKRVERVGADLARGDWMQLLKNAGFNPRLPTVWVLEGLLYYLKETEAKAVLETISRNSRSESVLLADFMNESSIHMGKEMKAKYYFHSDWPEELLPHLGYADVKVSQIGDKDANFGLVHDEHHMFNKIRGVPRHVISDDAGKPYHRLYLVEGKVSGRNSSMHRDDHSSEDVSGCQ